MCQINLTTSPWSTYVFVCAIYAKGSGGSGVDNPRVLLAAESPKVGATERYRQTRRAFVRLLYSTPATTAQVTRICSPTQHQDYG